MKVNNERNWWQTFAHQLKGVALVATMIAMGLSGTPVQAETVDKAPCMQDAAGFNLNCSANDIQLSEVTEEDINIIKPCLYPGDTTTFTAEFTTVLTAKARHDLGIYFAIDGDINGDGALTGECSVSSLAYQLESGNWLDLDGVNDPYVNENKASGIQDTCGDIDADHNPLRPVITITTTCVDDDGNGFLDLPYCTSWRQSGANELCTGPLAQEFDPGRWSSGVTPGAPSKCNCNPGFNVPVPVPPAELNVVKFVVPISVSEPGGSVVYSVSVNNMGVDPNNQVKLNSLIDNIYGDITVVSGSITDTNCSVPQDLIIADEPYSCNFTVAVAGNAGLEIPDIVTASGTDDRGNTITGYDDANVTITGVDPSILVDKTAYPTEVLEPGRDVQFTVKITNTSVSSDPVTINSLVDTVHGNLNGLGNCTIGFTIEPGESHTCSFTAFVGGAPGTRETDIVTASGTDDEGVNVSGSDSAVVDINDVPSSISLVKTASLDIINEPGGNVDFTFTVTNDSNIDTVNIDTFVDVVDGTTTDLNGEGNCSVGFSLAPHESYACTATFLVAGDAGESVTNTSTASGLDDDGVEVSASDTQTVNLRNVPPDATLVKTAESVIVNYSVLVTNLSGAESATIDSLIDNIYGNITDNGNASIIETDCVVPITLDKSGGTKDSYTCRFSAKAESSPTVDTVTGVVSDNEGGTVSPSDTASVTFE